MKKLTTLFLSLMMALSLIACGNTGTETDSASNANSEGADSASDNQDSVTLTFYANPSDNGAAAKVVEGFEKENPGIHVEIVEMPSGTDDRKTTLSTVFQAQDDSIDVCLIDCTWPDEFIGAGWLADQSDIYTEEELKEFIPSTLDICYGQDGGLYCTPAYINVGVLVYRDDLLKKYGFDAPAATWEELISQCETIVAGEAAEGNTIAGYTSAWKEFEGLSCCAFEFMWDYGAEFSKDGSCTLDSAEAVKGLSVMKELVDKNLTDPGIRGYVWTDSQAIFNAGGAVYMRDWPASYQSAKDPENSEVSDSVGITSIPAGDAGTFTTNGGWYAAVSAYSSHPEEAKLFAKYLSGYQGMLAYATENGMLPARLAVYDDAALEGSAVAELLPIADTCKNRPSSAYYSEYSSQIQLAVAAILDGSKDVQTGAQDMTASIQSLMDDYN